jgi:hypothetical protein
MSNKKVQPKIKRNPESIRIAPLHHPEPVLKIETPGKENDNELFSGKPHQPSATPKLIYNGGPLINNVKVFTIFWGKSWKSNTSTATLIGKINQYFTDILTSALIDQLGEYNQPNSKIGYGSFIGSTTITEGVPTTSIHDADIQKVLSQWIKTGITPKWDANTLYFIYVESGIKVIMGGGSSCSSFCGYHNNIKGKTYYAVMPFPTCSGCLGGMNVFDALTGTSSHELFEAITDPVPPTGWYDNVNGEIGDICAWKFKKVKGYTVQLEWSNKNNKCV